MIETIKKIVMKKIYAIVLIGIFTLVSCVDDDYGYNVPEYENSYLIVNGYRLPVNAAEIEYLGRDDYGRDVFDLVVTEDRFLGAWNTHTDQFILTRLFADQNYYTPEGYYTFNRLNNEIGFVDYAEDVDIIDGEFYASYYTGDFRYAEMEVEYLGDGYYSILGDFISEQGDDIQIDYIGPIYDYTDNNVGYPLATTSSRKQTTTTIKERKKIHLKE